MFLKQSVELQKIISNLEKQGKSKEQIKQAVNLYLIEIKKKFNPKGDLDIV